MTGWGGLSAGCTPFINSNMLIKQSKAFYLTKHSTDQPPPEPISRSSYVRVLKPVAHVS